MPASMLSAAPSPVLPGLPFVGRALLAPMEGVTEPCFRDLMLDLHADGCALGGAFTEFARVVDHPLSKASLARHLGPRRHRAPVGLQLMGASVEALAESAARTAQLGVPLVDLNFGCPAKGALRGCAGSALLRDPAALERLVSACARACAPTPVSAKIRAGYDDDRLLEQLARAAEQGGAALLTVHCRTRAEGYQDEVDWTRIARAVAAVRIPVCGNGGVERHGDLARMRAQTACALVMVGRGALADPWIFSGARASRAEAAAFLLDYARRMGAQGGFSSVKVMARLKQLLRLWRAGELCTLDRADWLRVATPRELLARLQDAAGAREPVDGAGGGGAPIRACAAAPSGQ